MTVPLDDAAFVKSIMGRHMLSNEEIDRLVALAQEAIQQRQTFADVGEARLQMEQTLRQRLADAEALVRIADAARLGAETNAREYEVALERAEARVRELEETLQRYGRHWESCPGAHPAYCECGLTAALAQRMT